MARRMLNRQLLYLIGIPGSGKTTLTEAVLGGVTSLVRKNHTVPHCEYGPGRVQLGFPREGHGGTDALSMSIAPKVFAALEGDDWEYVFAEGDRLATKSFFNGAKALGWNLRVLWLLTPIDVAMERRAARGSTQDETWLKGRITKVYNLGRAFGAEILDGSLPVAELAASLREEEVIRALLGEDV